MVRGTPFYGYHPQPKLFVQIFLYNPRVTQTVVQLLESGCVADRKFQPYESHIPFLLQVCSAHCSLGATDLELLTHGAQVFADYNIEGMNFVQLSGVKVPCFVSGEICKASVANTCQLRSPADRSSEHQFLRRNHISMITKPWGIFECSNDPIFQMI